MAKKEALPWMTELLSRSSDDVAEALAEDRQVEKILRQARARPAPLATEQSIRAGEKIMTKMRHDSAAAMRSRIRRGELITQDELLRRLDGNRSWLTTAVASNRVFSVRTESGIDYFPVFFAGSLECRRDLGKVAKLLVRLPSTSRYHFFVSKSFVLGATPLEALADGRLAEVVKAAIGFAKR